MITTDKVKNQIQSLITTANEKTGNNDADLTSAVESLVDGFGGGDSYYDTFWDAVQENGNRVDYTRAFYGKSWKDVFSPKYDIKPAIANQAFQDTFYRTDEMVSMKELEEKQGITFDFSNCTSMGQAFRDSFFGEINVLDISSAGKNITYLFYHGQSRDIVINEQKGLKRIERLICSESNVFATSTFQYCYGVEYIGFEGIIATNIDLQWSELLNTDSVQALINCLADLTGQTAQVLTVHPDVLAKIEANPQQLASITDKNWTLA